MYGTDNIFAKADIEIANWEKPANHNVFQYAQALSTNRTMWARLQQISSVREIRQSTKTISLQEHMQPLGEEHLDQLHELARHTLSLGNLQSSNTTAECRQSSRPERESVVNCDSCTVVKVKCSQSFFI